MGVVSRGKDASILISVWDEMHSVCVQANIQTGICHNEKQSRLVREE